MSEKIKIYYSLIPLSILYGAGVYFRNKLFDWNIKKSRRFDVPVISVGNLAVGGTGKTPHIEYLIRLLSPEFKVAVLSRGYRRKSKGFVLGDSNATPDTLGDEPYQIFSKFKDITVAVDADRCQGIDMIMQERPDTQVILLDDAFQHRYVKPGLSIVLSDYNRPYYQDTLMPAGRLRETPSGMKRADICVVSKSPLNLTDIECRTIKSKLKLNKNQQLFFSGLQYSQLVNVYSGEEKTFSCDTPALIMTGIAQPAPLREHIGENMQLIDMLRFGDHHDFTIQDVEKAQAIISKHSSNKPAIIIVTEKDAVKLRKLPVSDLLREKIYYLPLEIVILQERKKLLNNLIIEYVRKNKRNC